MEFFTAPEGRLRQTRVFPAPLCGVTVECAGGCITGLWFEGQKYYGSGRTDFTVGGSEALDAAFDWLERYFAGENPDASALRLAPEGTAFQLEVWRALCDIPYGEVTTYGALAASLHRPGSARAAGSAVGRNPISVLIPCHRIIGATGSLTGYAGGLERKKWLLTLERPQSTQP